MRELERDLPATTAAPAAPAEVASLTIVGTGRVGGTLARAARAAGIEVALLGRGERPEPGMAEPAAVLLCVPDREVESACERAASWGATYVGHTSGSLGLAALASASSAGAEAFTLHPLQTIPSPESRIAGAPCAISGASAGALETARTLALAVGMRPFEVAEESRAAYHAAASIASNFLVALEESAADLLARAGVTDARGILAPLVLRSAANWSEHGAAALTGPIARGDEATVERHLAALRDTAPELIDLYQALAERTRAIARAGDGR